MSANPPPALPDQTRPHEPHNKHEGLPPPTPNDSSAVATTNGETYDLPERRYSHDKTTIKGFSTIPPPHLRNNYLKADFPTVTHTPESLRERLLCGPLLRYTSTDYRASPAPLWNGTVLVVTTGIPPPRFTYENVGDVEGSKIYTHSNRDFWRFKVTVPLADVERKIEYRITFDGHGDVVRSFWIPAENASMRIMFHSCNGFSVGSNEEGYSGPALWNDVLKEHSEKPIHVMLGGGDQIYSDGIRVNGPLKPWAEDMRNPIKRRRYPWTKTLNDDVDEWYCNNYIDWYATSPFSHANSQIPQINVWDDHDIIDGFGSYRERLMQSPVFLGIGGISHRWYLIFQHHTPPQGEQSEDPSFIMGAKPGPYIPVPSRSVYARLGRQIAFIGVDARTERTRHTINTAETYNSIFSRLTTELSTSPEISHILIMLGVPIAYPRLVWLEMLLSSPIFKAVRFLNKHFGIADSVFNKFDGKPDLADDLDDHYCARTHKDERNDLILQLQKFSRQHNVRISILSGDVHLAAVGRFYSKPELNIPVEADHRYIPNIISSAITNKPPPAAVANLLARRNKIHHLDDSTDEQLLYLFRHDVDGSTRGANKVTMPRRNYCLMNLGTHEAEGAVPERVVEQAVEKGEEEKENEKKVNWRGRWEMEAGDGHPSLEGAGVGGESLNVVIRVEVDKGDPSGRTKGYGFSVPRLVRTAEGA